MDSFVFVRPTGKAFSEDRRAGGSTSQLAFAISEWRGVFRGEPRVKEDIAVNDADIAATTWCCSAIRRATRVYKRIASRLPIDVDAGRHHGGVRTFPAATTRP